MRVIIDTNVLVSAVFFDGFPSNLLKLLEKKEIENIISNEVSIEYKRIAEGFAAKTGKFERLKIFNNILLQFEVVESTTNLQICRDPNDNMFINCAIDGKCKYIVSGDKDLLVLENVENIEIVTVRDFLKEFNIQ